MYITRDDVRLWIETLGNPKHPAVILIAGAGAHAHFWSDSLCSPLVDAGYFVVRFDHRDTGMSSAVDYDAHPYQVKDLAEDVLAIMNALQFEKAHVVGHSMGGTIAQYLAIHHPERLNSYASLSVATVGNQPPSEEVMATLMENQPTQNFQESLPGFMRSWVLLNGDLPVDQEMAESYTRELYERSIHPVGVAWNHIHAQEKGEDYAKGLQSVKVPGLFIHGEKDPLIPVEGGIRTAQAAPHAKLEIIPGMGHMIFDENLQKRLASLLLSHFAYSG